MSRTLILIVSLTAALRVFQETVAQSKSSFDGFKLVDKPGDIRKPDDYSDRYQMLGAYMVIDQKGNQMHDMFSGYPVPSGYGNRHATAMGSTG